MNFKLNVAKWRCGWFSIFDKDSISGNGEGDTLLLNQEGYSCCLGQFGQQLGIEDSDLLNKTQPQEVSAYEDSIFVDALWGDNSRLSEDLMDINDDDETSTWTKAMKIRSRLKRNGHTLQIVNARLLKGKPKNWKELLKD